MTDRRAKTSRANLGDHIPEALGSGPSTVVAVRLPPNLLAELDKYRGTHTRSDFVRQSVEATVGFMRDRPSPSGLGDNTIKPTPLGPIILDHLKGREPM